MLAELHHHSDVLMATRRCLMSRQQASGGFLTSQSHCGQGVCIMILTIGFHVLVLLSLLTVSEILFPFLDIYQHWTVSATYQVTS